jgi:hypothetical protein
MRNLKKMNRENLLFSEISKLVCLEQVPHYLLAIFLGVERPQLKISLVLLFLKTSHYLVQKTNHNLINYSDRICLGHQHLVFSLGPFSKPHSKTHFSEVSQTPYSVPPSLDKAVYLAIKPVCLGLKLMPLRMMARMKRTTT